MKNNFEKDGIVLLNKVKGVSSFGAINHLKRIVGAKKVGHTGTLDPMAEGVIMVLINNATKFSDDLMKRDKEYYVEMELGYETDSYDLEGTIVKEFTGKIEIDDEKIKEVINSFLGKIEQIPPMYSAIKIDGKKLYDLARKGIELERKPRKVEVKKLREIKILRNEKIKISFFVEVSSGTYIRSLVRDIGEKLGVFATMTRLVRTKIDQFVIEDAVTIDELEQKFLKFDKNEEKNLEKLEKLENLGYFAEIEYVLEYLGINVSNEKYEKLKNGMTVLTSHKKFENISKKFGKKIIVLPEQKYKIYVRDRRTQAKVFRGIIKVVKVTEDRIYLKRDKYFL